MTFVRTTYGNGTGETNGVVFRLTSDDFCRDNIQQRHMLRTLQQSKVDARTAMAGLQGLEEKQKALRKQIIRARAEHEELLEDGKQACSCSKSWSEMQPVLLLCIALHLSAEPAFASCLQHRLKEEQHIHADLNAI